MNLSDYVLSFLEKKNVKNVFTITGGAICFLMDAFSRNKNIDGILSMERIYVGSRIRDLKYFKKANVFILALEDQVELGILKLEIE